MRKIVIALLLSCFATFTMAQTRTHVVKRGETYQSIAEKYGISEENLKSYNTAHPTCYVGLKVNVPYSNQAYTPTAEPENEYDRFIRIAKAAIEQHDIESAYQLAQCYEKGQGTDKDEEHALVWYKYGYMQNHVQSSLDLARCFEKGIGTKADEHQALRIYGDLAEHENSSARSHLRSLGYEDRAWPFLAQYGEVPQFVKEKWEAEARRQEAERKRKEAAARKKQQQNAAQQNVQYSQNSVATTNSYSTTNVASQQPARSADRVFRTPFFETTYHDNGNGTSSTVTKSVCTWCKGTGQCDACQYVAFAPDVYRGVCPMCHNLRVCTKCNGKRYMMSYGMMDHAGNGYSIGEDGSIGVSNGRLIGGSSSSSSSSSGSSSGSRSTCPRCGGKRYQSQAYSYAAASLSGYAQPYHHHGGSGCPYCSSSSDHYHYPCNECAGHGTIRH